MEAKMSKAKFSLRGITERALDYSYFKKVIKAKYWPGEGRILLVTGDNSSGKSFFGKLFSEIVTHGGYEKIKVMHVSMQLRAAGNLLANIFIFGDESWKATGEISVYAVLSGLRTCRSRTNDHILLLDEPDVGLSESYQGALGQVIRKFAEDLPDKTKALCLVTHSRRIVKHLMPLHPHYLRLGDEKSIDQFLEEPEDKTIDDLKNLTKISLDRFREIAKCINEGKNKKRKTYIKSAEKLHGRR